MKQVNNNQEKLRESFLLYARNVSDEALQKILTAQTWRYVQGTLTLVSGHTLMEVIADWYSTVPHKKTLPWLFVSESCWSPSVQLYTLPRWGIAFQLIRAKNSGLLSIRWIN